MRDDKAGLPLLNHWSLFGGGVEDGEAAEAALQRELLEELDFAARECRWFHEAIYVLPRPERRVSLRRYYAVPIEASDVDAMTLREGAGMRLLTPADILALERIAPWDLGVILMHARHEAIFGR